MALHETTAANDRVALELFSFKGAVGISVDVPQSRLPFLHALQDAYPGVTVSTAKRETNELGRATTSVSLQLSSDIFSLRTFPDSLGNITADPMTGLLSAIRVGKSGRIECRLTLTIQPASSSKRRQAQRIATRAVRQFASDAVRRWYLGSAGHLRRWRRVLAILALIQSRKRPSSSGMEPPKLHEPLFECWLQVEVAAPPDAQRIALSKIRDVVGAMAQFNSPETQFVASRPKRGPAKIKGRGFLLSPAEIATLWHLPTESAMGVSRLQVSEFRELEPPVCLPGQTSQDLRRYAANNQSPSLLKRTGPAGLPSRERESGVTVLGRVRFRQQREQFGVRLDDLRRHLLVVGKTGCGKSTFLQNVVLQQIDADRGVILIDPHGQLVDDVLDFIPRRRTNDVILFDAGDREQCIAFNPLVGPPGSDTALVADGVLTAFKKVFGFDETSAPRMLHIFRNCLLTLIGRPDASLLAVQRLLTDVNYRKSVTAQVTNPVVREFWLSEFGKWSNRDRTQYIASLQNKLGAFTTNERLQRIFGPSKRGLNLRAAMDSSQILLCNLSKGIVGQDASTLLGSLLISSIQMAALSRADTPEPERVDTVIVIDEFHSYLHEGNTAMAEALAESRKYRTSYVLSTQLLEQLDKATLAGVLGNCGSLLSMTVGPRDAQVLAESLGKGLTADDLMRIPKYHGYLQLLVDGTARTFSMTTQAPPRSRPRRAEVVRRASRL